MSLVSDKAVLDVANRKLTGDIADAIVDGSLLETMDGANELELVVTDPHGRLMGSEVLLRNAVRQTGDPQAKSLRPIDLDIGGNTYRLAGADRNGDQVTLRFMPLEVAQLRRHDKELVASRGSVTRAQFIRRMVDEVGAKARKVKGRRVRAQRIGFWSPGVGRRQPLAEPSKEQREQLSPEAEEPRESTAERSRNVRGVTVKGDRANAEQRRNMRTCFDVAEAVNAGPRAVKAMIVAAIGESGFLAIPNSAGSGYAGVFQAHPRNIPRTDTEEQCRRFFLGGKGFQAGGAIQAAKDHPEWSVGTIATRVEASGQPGSFYDAHADEADTIIKALGGRSNENSDTEGGGSYWTSYQFKRAKGENSWAAGIRLAEEVKWRLFLRDHTVIYAPDRELMRLPARARLSVNDPAVTDVSYQLDYRKTVREVTLTVQAETFRVKQGEPVVLEDDPAIAGKWLVLSVRVPYAGLAHEITLTQPQTDLPEPRPERAQREENEDAAGDGSDRETISVNGGGLTYPLEKRGQSIGGVAAHKARAWGNWQSDQAVDIAVSQGTAVVAVADGEIVNLGGSWRGGSGNPDGFNITLRASTRQWFYTHLRFRRDLRVGERVKAGDFLGSSGAANGVDHLHIATDKGDPERLLDVPQQGSGRRAD